MPEAKRFKPLVESRLARFSPKVTTSLEWTLPPWCRRPYVAGPTDDDRPTGEGTSKEEWVGACPTPEVIGLGITLFTCDPPMPPSRLNPSLP